MPASAHEVCPVQWPTERDADRPPTSRFQFSPSQVTTGEGGPAGVPILTRDGASALSLSD